MKQSSEFSVKSIQWDFERPVTAIMSRGNIIKHVEGETLACPDCKGSEGYQVFDRGNWLWACAESKCIQLNCQPKKWKPRIA